MKKSIKNNKKKKKSEKYLNLKFKLPESTLILCAHN